MNLDSGEEEGPTDIAGPNVSAVVRELIDRFLEEIESR